MPNSVPVNPPQLPKLPTLPSGAHKVLIWDKDTGEEYERWPIDAREMLASGQYTTANPNADPETDAGEASETDPEVDPVPHVTEAAKLAAREHSPGVPLRATPEDKPPAKAPARKTQKAKEAKGE